VIRTSSSASCARTQRCAQRGVGPTCRRACPLCASMSLPTSPPSLSPLTHTTMRTILRWRS